MIDLWLETLPADLRGDPSCQLYRLAEEVIYLQLHDASSAKLLRDAVRFVSTLAEEHRDNPADQRFLRLLIDEPRAIELGLVMVATQLSQAKVIPREQTFYPAIMFERDVLSVPLRTNEANEPAHGLLWALVGQKNARIVEEIEDTCKNMIERGFTRGVRWPGSDATRRLRSAIASIRDDWENLANQLLFAMRQNNGCLSIKTVDAITAPARLPGRESILNNINRTRQRLTPEALMLSAMAWPIRADKLLGNMEEDDGSVRLGITYIEILWTGILRTILMKNRDIAALEESCREVILHDIAYWIAQGVDYHEEEVTLFNLDTKDKLDMTRRKRLSRQRERCLRGAFKVADPDWMQLLREIGALYDAGAIE